MKTRTVWKEKMLFSGESEGHLVSMDAKPPLGSGGGMTPKELVAIGLSGCTAMDVAALMKKYKQPVESFEVEANITQTEGHPVSYKDVMLHFIFKGNIEKDKVLEAVRLSQTKYCGVSAMLSKAVPIHYKVFINNEEVGSGQAEFS